MRQYKTAIQSSVVEFKGLGFAAVIHGRGEDPREVIDRFARKEEGYEVIGPFPSIEEAKTAGSTRLTEIANKLRTVGFKTERQTWVEPETITCEEYHHVVLSRGLPGLHEEKEWYRFKATYGLVIFDKTDKDWSFVVSDYKNGQYCAIDLGVSEKSAKDARQKLFRKMKEHEASKDQTKT